MPSQPQHALPNRPRYHFTAPAMWLNDPNGVGFHAGRWHLFYQYNPLAPEWGGIHWGHASSADLLHWRDEPVALVPGVGNPKGHDQHGCFSGCLAVVGGVPTLYYTGNDGQRQVQCVATAAPADTALLAWTKQPARTLTDPPPGVPGVEFRDPYVFQHGGFWYQVLGASWDATGGASAHGQRGLCLLYRSTDGVQWDYLHPLFEATSAAQGTMWECPNFVQIGSRWLLTVSVWPNLGALWFSGQFEAERFIAEAEGVLDVDGGAFAHLAAPAPDGRVLQWAWLNEQRAQHRIDADGWAGAMSVPRALSLDARGRLVAWPVAELAGLRGTPVATTPTGLNSGVLQRFDGTCLDIEATFTLKERRKAGLTLRASADGQEATRIVWWPEAQRLLIERERCSLDRDTRHQDVAGLLVLDDGEPLTLRVLLDHSVLEVYANGRLTLSTRIYPTLASSVQAWAWSDGEATVDLAAWAMAGIHPDREPHA